jgi:hypothetical protein
VSPLRREAPTPRERDGSALLIELAGEDEDEKYDAHDREDDY